MAGGGNFTVVVLSFGLDGCVPGWFSSMEAWLEGTDLCRTACFSAGLRNSRFRRMIGGIVSKETVCCVGGKVKH